MNLCEIFMFAFGVCQLPAVVTLATLPHTKCVRTYKKLGCFAAKSKPLDELLITDRDLKSPKSDGHKLNWKEWEQSIHSLACRCAEAARKGGFKVFGLQNYGECWSGAGAEKTYDRDGNSSNCLVVLSNPPPHCNINDPRECAGKENVNYIYSLDSNLNKDNCASSPCKNGGTCKETAGGFTCTCQNGYKGKHCDQDVNECGSTPCKNGGTCINTVGDYECKCKPGYAGKHCDQDVNECGSTPCKNGGTCINTLGSYECKCKPGNAGKHCDQDVNECETTPCKNGGTCINTVGSYECKCMPGYTGKHCEQVVDPCHNNPCQNGGSCKRKGNGFICKCVKGFTGKRCENDVNECKRSPCRNGATCVNFIGSFHCLCRPGFQGKLCKQDVNECAPYSPCKNGASCVNKHGGFKCLCPAGFTGTLCDQDVDECKKSPCTNGATCVNNMGSFHCLCRPGFEGKLCERDVNECAPYSPCKNGARCENTNGGFKCLCPAGITGLLCDLDVNECQQQKCSNGGTCVNTQGSFYCKCKSGYSGKYCEKGGNCNPAGQYDLGILIDGSGSVGNYGFAQTKMFLLQLIPKVTVGADATHFGVIIYSDQPQLVIRFSDKMYYIPVYLKLRILGLEFPDGLTRTDKALEMAGSQLYAPGKFREQVPRVLVVFTDGETSQIKQGNKTYEAVLKPLKDRGVNIIAIGVGNEVSTTELKAIAMGRSDRVLQVSSLNELDSSKLAEMIKSIC